ncbi:putative gaba permease protein [Eutypa lata UCREL1]|uniref:Putative gaba permease protein n=1 Tax=Eutypa lata (strain UCR-EL1) TaxID=1287681 RepID=M7SXK2_EUTLA|nr:putative gaba permease protein [Eutypa lata UCREL1]
MTVPHEGSRRHSRVEQASAALEQMGLKQELKRNFSMTSMLGLAFAILNTWTALAASITLALPSGGPSAVIWGLMVAGVCNLCLAASLAEFLSAWPTAGGQYHWAAIVAWEGWSRGISYVTGWINVAGWVALTATGGLLGSTFIVETISLFNPAYEPEAWHQFLIYIAFTLVALVVNAFLNRVLPYVTKAAFFWSITGFVVISITVLACSAPNYQSGSFVYGNFINDVGWPDGLAWLLGLLQGAFALTGFDATVHMIEEIPEPHIQGPRIMIYCIGIGMFTGFIFLSCLLFCVNSIDDVLDAASGPLLQIFMDATSMALGITYAIPPAINVLRGRKMLPPSRAFRLSEPVGWTLNLVGIAWALLTTVLFVFPPELPVTSDNMNYCIVAFGIILLIAGLTWIFDGRKNYVGPHIQLSGVLHGKEDVVTEPLQYSGSKPHSDIVETR